MSEKKQKSTKPRASGGRWTRWLVIIAVLGALGIVGAWFDYRGTLSDPLVEGDTVRNIHIPKGVGVRGIIEILEREGLVADANHLRFYLWRNEKSRRLKPGVYRIDHETSLTNLIDDMAEGKTSSSFRLTVPEGTNVYEIAAKLEAQGLVDAKVFVAKATEPAFLASLGVKAPSLEGYLFPARYPIAPGSSEEAILKQMHTRFNQSWREIEAKHAPELAALKNEFGFDTHRLLTLASIVEEEAAIARERVVIARVFFNRLRVDQKLETDPTCVYPPEFVGEKPTPRRCHDPKNPYSTYEIQGLPPTPISNMGVAAIEAVLSPLEGPHAEKYIFFAARHDGSRSHYFSATHEEHQQAVDFYLKKSSKVAPTMTPQPQ